MIEVVPYTEDHIVAISHWYQNREWPIPFVANAMPAHGFVAKAVEGGALLACCWVRFDGTSVAELSWPGVNPIFEADVQKLALTAVVKKCVDIFKSDVIRPEVALVTCFTRDDQIIDILKGCEFRAKRDFTRMSWLKQ